MPNNSQKEKDPVCHLFIFLFNFIRIWRYKQVLSDELEPENEDCAMIDKSKMPNGGNLSSTKDLLSPDNHQLMMTQQNVLIWFSMVVLLLAITIICILFQFNDTGLSRGKSTKLNPGDLHFDLILVSFGLVKHIFSVYGICNEKMYILKVVRCVLIGYIATHLIRIIQMFILTQYLLIEITVFVMIHIIAVVIDLPILWAINRAIKWMNIKKQYPNANLQF